MLISDCKNANNEIGGIMAIKCIVKITGKPEQELQVSEKTTVRELLQRSSLEINYEYIVKNENEEVIPSSHIIENGERFFVCKPDEEPGSY